MEGHLQKAMFYNGCISLMSPMVPLQPYSSTLMDIAPTQAIGRKRT